MGLYKVDKPTGISSNKALSEFKKEHNVSKAGFSGVLDPFASGLLIIATEGHTKLLDIFLGQEKTYSGTILFGKSTDTYDTEGEVLEEKEVVDLTKEMIEQEIAKSFIGKIEQVPPVYSNIKVDGKRARDLALKGKEVTLKPKQREIYSFEITSFNGTEANFLVKASSGTYIRSLAFDLGKNLGYPSMLTALRRESIGYVLVGDGELDPYLTSGIPTINISTANNKDLLDGKSLNLDYTEDELITLSDNDLWLKRRPDFRYKIHKRLR